MAIKLKIGRHTYYITENDRFLDNGSCVQLLTQSKERSIWGRCPSPKLSKRAVRELKGYTQVEYPYNSHCDIKVRCFGISLDNGAE